ncbi:MAG: DegT/DnrJ/EryC1/StrS family aminotransferase [Dehalococcoidia bacterium]|nr:DegT/DnrJ/EryC1/StrS family aminotransferase [Dehalococcoidia bacterium]
MPSAVLDLLHGEIHRPVRAQFATADAKSSVTVCNGTVALHLALLGRGSPDEIVPSLTFVATANACRYVGAEPVFVDVDPNTVSIEADRNTVTRRTKGIIRFLC